MRKLSSFCFNTIRHRMRWREWQRWHSGRLQRQIADVEAKLEDVRSRLNDAESEVVTLTN